MQDTGYKIQDVRFRITDKKTIIHHASCIVHRDRRGVTLVELIIVIAIIGIIALFATIDTAWFQREARVTEARDRLLADVEDARLKSLAQVPHAIVMVSATSYKMVSLNDTNNNFRKDTSGTPETTTDIANSTVTLSTNVKVSLSAGTGTELWFDRKGIPRTSTWTMDGNCSATSATVCDVDSDCLAGETCNRTFTVWYDADGDGVRDADEITKRIDIGNGGKIQYEQ